jgi:hypothetical protein
MSDAPVTYAPPTVEDARAWIDTPATVVDDEQLQTVLDAELALQAKLCTVEPWSPALTQALLRRVGREVAAMALPLGVIAPDGEFGGANLPRFDAEIERLERPFRRVVIG